MSRRDIWIPIGAGVILGTFCAFANYSSITSSVGQMVTPWVLTAAIVGALATSRGRAALGGLIAMPVAVAVYYAIAAVDRGLTTQRYFLIWTGLGLLVGPLFGATGWLTRHGSPRWRTVAAGAIMATVLAEVAVIWRHISQLDAVLSYSLALAVGLSIPFAALRDLDWRRRAWGIVIGLAFAVPCYAVLEFVFERVGMVTPS